MIDAEKLTKWSKEIYENAVAHGWHEEKHSSEHYLGLVMTEVAEAVEADRKNKRANTYLMREREAQKTPWWKSNYEQWVKGSIEEEFADIVIRLLDMAVELHGDDFVWKFPKGWIRPNKNLSVCENAWIFVRYSLNTSIFHIVGSICFVHEWAEHLGIDLDTHIELKMRYNATREYKHGNKKY